MSVKNGKKIDLHTHSVFSDGELTPEQLLEEAQWAGLSAIALTDHDNVDGVERGLAAGKECGIEVIPGVELSCEFNGIEAHVIGLLLEPTEVFKKELQLMRENRETRMDKMVQKLKYMGMKISSEELPRTAGMSLGRPHLARLLVKKGICRNISEAFEKYIGDRGPAYVAKKRWSAEDGIRLIKESKGVSILAHPGASGLLGDLNTFIDLGINGIEVHYPQHSPQVEKDLLALCKEKDLLVCGGSDFHAHGVGPSLGIPYIPYEVLQKIKERKDALWQGF